MEKKRENIYKEVFLKFGRNEQHYISDSLDNSKDFNHKAEKSNPTCGDRIAVYAHVDQRKIKQLKYSGDGCLIARASAAIMCEILSGEAVDRSIQFFDDLHAVLNSKKNNAKIPDELMAFSELSTFPTRHSCATLAWSTLQAALSVPLLHSKQDEVS